MPARLGDDIDDYCVKCKRVMNHSVVSLMDNEPAKVRCRTCHSDHDYRHEQAPPPKVDSRKAALFNEVLNNVTGGASADSAAAAPGQAAPAQAAPADAAPAQAAPAQSAPAKGRKKAKA